MHSILLSLFLFMLVLPATAATLTRTSSFSYDAATGFLIQETIEPDKPALKQSTAYTYDTYGNRITATVTGADFATRSNSTTYNTNGTFPVSSSNALVQQTTYNYDPKFGTLYWVRDANVLQNTYTVDTFGRPATAKGPDGVIATTSRGLCSNPGASCPARAAYYVTVSKPGAPTGTTYFDAFNREIRAQVQGFDGRWIIKDTSYDDLGRVASISRPYYSGDSVYVTAYTYDLLNRVLTETDADGKITYYDYYKLTVTRTSPPTASSPSGQTQKTTRNSQGQIISVTDAANKTLSYSFDPFGNLIQTIDTANNVTTLGYDLRGRKISMNDPDMGIWSYTYNALGELTSQTDAKGQITTYTYDLLGRMTQRAEPDLMTTWTYDTATTKGIGKLASSTTGNGQTRTYTYDTKGRPSSVRTTLGTTVLTLSTTYDTLGRVDTQTDPAGLAVQNVYNTYGYLAQIRDTQTLQVYWTANALSAEGQLISAVLGNAVTETRTVDPLGRITGMTSSHALGTVTSMNYTYDALSNLTTRTDVTQNLTETYGYDALNRLTSVVSSNPNQAAKTLQYNSLGNITTKSDTGTYTYQALRPDGSNRPHAVSSVTGTWNAVFQYDANGNMIVVDDRTISYTSFNLPYQITQNGQTTTLLYGADHKRMKQTDADGKVTLTLNPRFDLGGHYDQVTHPGGVVEKISHLYAGARPVAIYARNANGQPGVNALRYLHLDAQGSIIAITNEAGAVVERLAYDAWGKRRNPDGTDAASLHPQTTDHGYTGHMHLDDLGIIHMNGRTYDPRLARFMQADPIIQAPYQLQSYNRYSYVWNNPLVGVDPSGYRMGYSDSGSGSGGNSRAAMDAGYMPGYRSGGGWGGGSWSGSGGSSGGGISMFTYVPPSAPSIPSMNFSGGYNGYGSGAQAQINASPQKTIPGGNYSANTQENLIPRTNTSDAALPTVAQQVVQGAGDKTLIVLGYTTTPVGMGTNHALVIATDTVTGDQYATRAGPSIGKEGVEGRSGIGLGTVNAIADAYNKAFKDSPSIVHTTQEVGTVNLSITEVSNRMVVFAHAINARQIPYLVYNSNGYAYNFVQSLGLSPTPVVSAPGWGIRFPMQVPAPVLTAGQSGARK